MIGKENDKIKNNRVRLSAQNNGYRIIIYYNYDSKEMQDAIEKALANSKFQ